MPFLISSDNSDAPDSAPAPPPPSWNPAPPPPQAPAPQPPPPAYAPQAETLAQAEAAVLALVAQGMTGADALARHPLPAGTSTAVALAFLAQLPQTTYNIDTSYGPGIVTGPPIATLTGEDPGDEITDPTAYDGWEFDPFFGSGGGLSEDEAEVKILRGSAFVTQCLHSANANGIDVLAAWANAIAEGISGALGDQGSAYGPWQIHATDGRIASFNGLPPYNLSVQGWAWTANGIDYAFRSMRAGGAKGLTGHQAVHAIVYGFERPADKPGAYAVRSTGYDNLLAKGSGATSYIAGLAKGPSLSVTPAGGPLPTTTTVKPTAISSTPTGSAWQDLMQLLAKDIPFAANHAQTLSDNLTALFR